jgi:hypothetical protein
MAQLRQYRSGGCLQWALQRRRQLTRLRRGRDNRIKASPALDNGRLFFVILSKSQCAIRGVYQSPWRCDDMHTLKVIWKFGNFYLVEKMGMTDCVEPL